MLLKEPMLQMIGSLEMYMEWCALEMCALIITRGRLFTSLYCQTPNNCIYLKPVQQMSNQEKVKALRMSEKDKKKLFKSQTWQAAVFVFMLTYSLMLAMYCQHTTYRSHISSISLEWPLCCLYILFQYSVQYKAIRDCCTV